LEHFIEITVASSHSKHLILQVHTHSGDKSVGEICETDYQITSKLFIKRSNAFQPLGNLISSSLGVGGGEGGTKTFLLHGTRP